MYGKTRIDVSDHSTALATLLKNAWAWDNSGLCTETPDALQQYMDAQPREKRKDCLRIWKDLTDHYGFPTVMSALEETARRGNVNFCDASVLANRITGYGIDTPPESELHLTIYDEVFLKQRGAEIC